jgi:hypothetical protein
LARAARAPSAYSDAEGRFTVIFPDRDELPGESVQFVALSPTGRRIGAREFRVGDLSDDITIEVEPFDPAPPEETTSPEHTAVKGIFETDKTFRRTITENLKPLRVETAAVDHRIETAFAFFHSTPLPADVREARHYVKPNADPGAMLEKVITEGANALGSGDNKRAMTLRKSAGLNNLMTETDGDGGAIGNVDLDQLIQFINKKSRGSITTEPVYTRCKAEKEADDILAVVEAKAPANGNPVAVANALSAPSDNREPDQLVKDSVTLQMHSATSPEARLDYGSMPAIPNTADSDGAQTKILQTFELRPGASDVTAYHDFHTLQIAFQHVWSRIFDAQLENLGRDLYREYVKLKDFSGATGPDLTVGTADDLRRLMDEVKKLSQIVQDDIPDDLRGNGSGNKDPKGAGDLKRDIKTGVDIATGIATGGLTWILDLAVKEFAKAGSKPIIRWEDFPGPWAPRTDRIFLSEAYNVVPAGQVEIVLKTDVGSHRKIIEFEPLDQRTSKLVHGPRISTAGDGSLSTMALTTTQIENGGVLEFASEESISYDLGRYVLADLPARLKDGRRVTFYWRDY